MAPNKDLLGVFTLSVSAVNRGWYRRRRALATCMKVENVTHTGYRKKNTRPGLDIL